MARSGHGQCLAARKRAHLGLGVGRRRKEAASIIARGALDKLGRWVLSIQSLSEQPKNLFTRKHFPVSTESNETHKRVNYKMKWRKHTLYT